MSNDKQFKQEGQKNWRRNGAAVLHPAVEEMWWHRSECTNKYIIPLQQSCYGSAFACDLLLPFLWRGTERDSGGGAGREIYSLYGSLELFPSP